MTQYPSLRRAVLQTVRRMASDTMPKTYTNGKAREKVMLKPGFHLMDWMRLTQTANDLSGRAGKPASQKIPPSELKKHKSKYDAWTSFNGKVYNITQYMAYHPGGEEILMKVAGQDCTVQFNKFHKWVNIENMLGKCVVGVVGEETIAIQEEEDEDEDDDDEEEEENEEKVDVEKNKAENVIESIEDTVTVGKGASTAAEAAETEAETEEEINDKERMPPPKLPSCDST